MIQKSQSPDVMTPNNKQTLLICSENDLKKSNTFGKLNDMQDLGLKLGMQQMNQGKQS